MRFVTQPYERVTSHTRLTYEWVPHYSHESEMSTKQLPTTPPDSARTGEGGEREEAEGGRGVVREDLGFMWGIFDGLLTPPVTPTGTNGLEPVRREGSGRRKGMASGCRWTFEGERERKGSLSLHLSPSFSLALSL